MDPWVRPKRLPCLERTEAAVNPRPVFIKYLLDNLGML
jgi:hypothetical protein